jgi:hypothetical protein
VPLFQATAATASRGMLRHKHGMAAHGRLPPVARWICRRQAFGEKFPAVLEDNREGSFGQIGSFLPSQYKPAAKFAPRQGGK